MTWVNLRAGELIGSQGLINHTWGEAFRGAQTEYDGMIEDAIEDSDYTLSRREAIESIAEAVEEEIVRFRKEAARRNISAICKAKTTARIESEKASDAKKFDFDKFPTFGCDSNAPKNVLINKHDQAEERRRANRSKAY
jgi:hypothetical protein